MTRYAVPDDVQPIDWSVELPPKIKTIDDASLSDLLCGFIEYGPSDMIEPVEREFARRGVDPYTVKPLVLSDEEPEAALARAPCLPDRQ